MILYKTLCVLDARINIIDFCLLLLGPVILLVFYFNNCRFFQVFHEDHHLGIVMVLFFYSSPSIFLFCVLSAAEFLQDDTGSHQNLRLSALSTVRCPHLAGEQNL